MVCGRAQNAGAAAAETAWKRRRNSAYTDGDTTHSLQAFLFPLAAVCLYLCAGGGTPEYKQGRSAGKGTRGKLQSSVEHESEEAEGKVNKMLDDSGGDENNDGREKMWSPCHPAGLVTGYRIGGCEGNPSKETRTGGRLRTPWRQECLSSALHSVVG